MNRNLTRREFIVTTAAGALAVGLGLPELAFGEARMPRRVLGKTGVQVPMLGYGTATTGERRTLKDAIALYNEAIDLGVNYMDTAPEFAGYGKAQGQLGHVLKERRREVFLVTKCFEPDGDKALQLLQKNLKELQTDHADLVYAHSVGDSKMDMETIIGKGGVMEMLVKAKREGLTRFIGISGHSRPWKFLKVLENFEIDVMMNVINFVDQHTYDFEGKVWPVAAKQKIGLVAMKVFGGPNGKSLSNRMMPEQLIPEAVRYSLSVPNVSTAVIGMATQEELRRNVQLVKAFKPLTAQEKENLNRIGADIAKQWGAHFGSVT